MAYVYMEESELNELYKEAHENNYSQKNKDLLIELGANPNVIGYSIYEIITMTPDQAFEVFDREVRQNEPNIELIKNIVEHSLIDVNKKDSENRTLLMMASLNGHTESVRMLLERSEIDVNLQDKWGKTALIYASDCGRTEVVKGLLERPEILVTLQTEDGETALIYASDWGRTEIVQMLLERPEIDKTIKYNNKTAWGFASDSLRRNCPDLQPKRKSTTKTNLRKELLNAIESGKDISELKKMLQ